MPYRTLKLILAGALTTLALLAPRGAAAQTGGTTGTAAALTTSDFTLYLEKYDGGNWVQMNTTEQQYFFNQARCQCIADQKDWSGYFKVAIQPASTTGDKIRALLNQNGVGSGFAALYAGSNAFDCLTTSTLDQGLNYCVNLLDPTNFSAGIPNGMATIAANKVWLSDPIPVARVFNAAGSATSTRVCTAGKGCDDVAACNTASANLIIYFWTQTNSGRTVDVDGLQLAVNAVGQASPSFVPTNVVAKGGNNALTVTWDWPGGLSPSGVGSFLGTQLFCVRGPDVQVFKSGFSPSYLTPQNTCADVAPASSAGIAALDPAFLCSGLIPSTSQSYRITGLQNDIYYGVAAAAIDRYGNAGAVGDLVYGKPVATVDFYTEYRELGGDAKGGYCAVVNGMRAPGALGAGLLVAIGLLVWRRRKPRGPGAGLFIMILGASALIGARANAQDEEVFRDDMGMIDNEHEAWAGTPREFAIEARFGLYTPAVDSEFAKGTKPQSFIFGNKRRPMWQMEFDWELLHTFGTLAVGGAIGYYKENNGACTRSTLTATNCDRDTGDNTGLRLIPLAALVIYRFDVLAERWKIPLAPYGKVGLNYTLWNVTDGNGDTPSAKGGKGAGGTAGWQAAVGLALQMDFLDPGAARGFDADVGVNHTYAFFELDTIQSSGLGKSGALHVGDNTWFAGLMFEF